MGSIPRCLRWGFGGGQDRLEHWTESGKGVNCDWDEYHVFVVEFAYDVVAVDRWGGGSYRFVDSSKFVSFVHLKMAICVGSDGLDNVFRCMMVWGWCGSCDGDICTDGGVGAAVVGGGGWVE
jgi:hypothetical protein